MLDEATEPDERTTEPLGAIVSSAMLVHAVSAMVELGVVELLERGPGQLTDLASGVGVDPERLRVVLRAAAATELVREPTLDQFELTAAGERLRGDDPSGLRDLFRMCTHGDFFGAWTQLSAAVRSDLSPFELHTRNELFGYLAEHPEQAAIFHRAMTSSAPVDVLLEAVDPRRPATVADLSSTATVADLSPTATVADLSSTATVADLGGGEGSTLAAVLRAYPASRGVLFDLPEVVAGADPVLRAAGVADRCTLVGGSFFEPIPVRADLYLMVRVLQNWAPDDAVRILGNVRTAMPDNARLLVVGHLSDRTRPDPLVEAIGLSMFVHYGAAFRTADECERLFARAGLRLHAVHRASGGGRESVLDVRPGLE